MFFSNEPTSELVNLCLFLFSIVLTLEYKSDFVVELLMTETAADFSVPPLLWTDFTGLKVAALAFAAEGIR